MKRFLIVGGIVVMLVVAATAYGGVRRYVGKAIGGAEYGRFAFRAEIEHGKPVEVRRFRWRDVPVHCTIGGDWITGGHFTFAMPVVDNRFQDTADNGIGGRAHAEGRFRRRSRRAVGRFRVHGKLDSDHSDCDTGTVYWRAHRVRAG